MGRLIPALYPAEVVDEMSNVVITSAAAPNLGSAYARVQGHDSKYQERFVEPLMWQLTANAVAAARHC